MSLAASQSEARLFKSNEKKNNSQISNGLYFPNAALKILYGALHAFFQSPMSSSFSSALAFAKYPRCNNSSIESSFPVCSSRIGK